MSLEYNTSSSNMKLKKKKKSFINCQWRKEMYLQSYGARHMVKDHSVSKRWTHCHHYMGNLSNYQQGFLYAPSHRIVHNTVFVTPVVEHWLEREIAQWVNHEGSIRQPTAPWTDTLPWSYSSFQNCQRFKLINPPLNHRSIQTMLCLFILLP